MTLKISATWISASRLDEVSRTRFKLLPEQLKNCSKPTDSGDHALKDSDPWGMGNNFLNLGNNYLNPNKSER